MTVFASGRGAIARVKTAGGGGGVTTPSILGTTTVHVNSTSPHTTDTQAHTVTAGTEILLLLVLYGKNTSSAVTETTPSSSVDGAFTNLASGNIGSGATSGMPSVGVWQLTSPTAGAHNITWGASLDLMYSAVVLINLDDTDGADPFGDLENIRVTGAASNTVASSLTTEKANSRIIAWAAAQGGDTDPFSEDLGLAQIVEFQTDAGTTVDAAMSVATKVGPSPAGAVSYGFTWSASDDYCHGAIEIRGAG